VPSSLMERSPKTKNAPSLLLESFNRCKDDTRVPARAVPRGPDGKPFSDAPTRLHDMKKYGPGNSKSVD
jgi:hypothetical protein